MAEPLMRRHAVGGENVVAGEVFHVEELVIGHHFAKGPASRPFAARRIDQQIAEIPRSFRLAQGIADAMDILGVAVSTADCIAPMSPGNP